MTKRESPACGQRDALELKNENPFKIRAYTNAARAIETFGGNVTNFQDEEALSKIPGIGKSIALKIKELTTNGSLKYLEELSWNSVRDSRIVLTARAWRQEDQGSPRQASDQFHRAAAKSVRNRARR